MISMNPYSQMIPVSNPYSQMIPVSASRPFLNSMFNPFTMIQALPQQFNPFSYGTNPLNFHSGSPYSSYPMSPSMSMYPSMSLGAQATFGIDELRDNFLETRQQQRDRKRVQKLKEKLRKVS